MKMKRINIFVLLCVLVFTMCAGAWAETTDEAAEVVAAPMNDHGATEDDDKNTEVLVDGNDYKAEITKKEGSITEPHEIKLTATGIPAHYNGAHTLAYWIGFGIKKDDDNENSKYSWGWEKGDTKTEATFSNYQPEKSTAKYDNFYFGTYTSFSHLNKGWTFSEIKII